MKQAVQWQDEKELFEAVVGALELGVNLINDETGEETQARVLSWNEEGPYGERGQILILVEGKKFSLELHQIH